MVAADVPLERVDSVALLGPRLARRLPARVCLYLDGRAAMPLEHLLAETRLELRLQLDDKDQVVETLL